ncbi:MAG: thermonuclease family protein [Clostridia bacterium]|nr:thermonuclease family protein [Clostridia bacterium]
MKTSLRIFSVVLLLCVLASCLASCEFPWGSTTTTGGDKPPQFVDYASQVKLDFTSTRARQEVTLHMHIDGDTTHFNLETPINGSSILKARYLGVDTPEFTGAIEKWGKKASNYTKEKLSNATSIIVESDTHEWNPDSTGSRYMVWVWYKTAEMTDYSLLNIELLQLGLAKRKGSDNVYGEYCTLAYQQAYSQKLHVWGTDVDPDYYIGEAIPVDLLELATNPQKYEGKKVVFEAIITRDFGNSIYLQAYNAETGMYHAIGAYYGYSFSGMDQLALGNLMKIVGTVQYWEGGGTYQISDLKYNAFSPKPEENIAMIETGHPVVYTLTSPDEFCNGKREIVITDEEGEEILKEFSYAELALNTAIEMHDLKVTDVWTTVNSESSKGAMTLTCEADGHTITVRTEVLYDENGDLVTEEYFDGKTIDVKGLVGYYNGQYQIKLLTLKDVVVE